MNHVIYFWNYVTVLRLRMPNFAFSNFISCIMKKTSDNPNPSASSEFDDSGSQSDDNQENGESKNGGNHFYFVMGDENNDLGEVISKWEAIRYMI